MQIRYHELAQADLLAAWSWYEDQQPGLGDQFITAVDVTMCAGKRRAATAGRGFSRDLSAIELLLVAGQELLARLACRAHHGDQATVR